MSEHKTIQEYLNTVAEQIRWKRARPSVTLELEQHLLDQRDAFMNKGCEDAERMAVEEMGDPVELGLRLDNIHRPQPQTGLLSLTILFAVVCAFLRVWLTAGWAYRQMNIDPLATTLSLCFGCIALMGCYFLDYTFLARHAKTLYVGALALGVLTFCFAAKINHVSYYTRYVASCCPVVYAAWMYSCRNKGWRGILYAIAGGIPLSLICLAASSVWHLLILVAVGLTLFLLAAKNDWFGIGKSKTAVIPVAGVLALASLCCYSYFAFDSLRLRIEAFLHPERDPLVTGYVSMTARKVLSVSRWLGEGQWTDELAALPYEMTMPNCESDQLLTTLIYKLGWLPFLLFTAVFAALVCWSLARCLRQRSQFGKMIALSILLPLCLRAAASIALTLGYVWLSVSFPLMIGNLQMILDMGMIGLTLSVFRQDGIAHNSNGVLHKKLRLQVIESEGLLISYK